MYYIFLNFHNFLNVKNVLKKFYFKMAIIARYT